MRTRGGSNKFHGRGYFFFRDESLNANTWKNNSLGLKRRPLQEQDPGFTLSGPIVIPKIVSYQAFLREMCLSLVADGAEVHLACSAGSVWGEDISTADDGVQIHTYRRA